MRLATINTKHGAPKQIILSTQLVPGSWRRDMHICVDSCTTFITQEIDEPAPPDKCLRAARLGESVSVKSEKIWGRD